MRAFVTVTVDYYDFVVTLYLRVYYVTEGTLLPVRVPDYPIPAYVPIVVVLLPRFITCYPPFPSP